MLNSQRNINGLGMHTIHTRPSLTARQCESGALLNEWLCGCVAQDRLARGEDADWSDEDDDEGFEVQGVEEDDEATMEAEERALGAKLKEEQAAELSDLQAENEMWVGRRRVGSEGGAGLPTPSPRSHTFANPGCG